MAFTSIAALIHQKSRSIAEKKVEAIAKQIAEEAKDWRKLVRKLLTARTGKQRRLSYSGSLIPRMQTGDLKSHFYNKIIVKRGSSIKRTPEQINNRTHLNVATIQVKTYWSHNPHGLVHSSDYGTYLNDSPKFYRYNGWRDLMQGLLDKRIVNSRIKGVTDFTSTT